MTSNPIGTLKNRFLNHFFPTQSLEKAQKNQLSNHSVIQTQSSQRTNPLSSITDQISSLAPEKPKKEFTGAELAINSTIAITIGFVPFIASKTGEFAVKGCVYITRVLRNLTGKLGDLGSFLEIPIRAIIGIPATIGACFLFGGAVVFSKLQALVWGQELIKHPQEERINTKLARYGAGKKPFEDFKNLLITFFLPFGGKKYEAFRDDDDNYVSIVGPAYDVDRRLKNLQKFEAT